jgi:hypothetical protein
MKLNKRIGTLIFFGTLMIISSCKKENRCDCFKRTGEIIKETRTVPTFYRVFVEDNISVELTQDSLQSVVVEAGDNIAPLIETEVTDGVLFLRNKNRCNWTRSYKKTLCVHISIPKLLYLTSDGTGNIKGMNTFTPDTMDIQTKNSGNIELTIQNNCVRSHMHGSGDLTLHGATNEHDISIGGTAYLYAKDLSTSYTYVHTFTTGTCYLDARDLFICRLDYIGDVHVYGHPTSFQRDLNGQGQIYFE